MYEFIDVNDAPNNLSNKPSEALKINGIYLEDAIEGYRTLSVTGREGLSKDINDFEVGASDGSSFLRRKYPKRVITVNYMISNKTPMEFREKYNKLASILNCENAKCIFNDESDKFYIGTPQEMGEIDGGELNVTGEFTIVCHDPFKYSVNETIITPNEMDKTLLVNYGGTYKSFPKLEVEFYKENEVSEDGQTETPLSAAGDCGYVAFFNAKENRPTGLLQFGKPDDVDWVLKVPPAKKEVSLSFASQQGFSNLVQKNWLKNSATILNPKTVQKGTIGMRNLGGYQSLTSNQWTFNIPDGTEWIGPTMRRKIKNPTDITAMDWVSFFCINDNVVQGMHELGQFQALMYDKSGKTVIAGVNMWKSKYGKTGTLGLYVNNKMVEKITIKLERHKSRFVPGRYCSIMKNGRKVTFNIAGIKRTYFTVPLEKTQVGEIAFGFFRRGNYLPMKFNAIRCVQLTHYYAEEVYDIPNQFRANDVLNVDCGRGKTYLNGNQNDSLGALGNDWESFYLEPGVNKINYSYSDWTDEKYAPKVKLKFREVFI